MANVLFRHLGGIMRLLRRLCNRGLEIIMLLEAKKKSDFGRLHEGSEVFGGLRGLGA